MNPLITDNLIKAYKKRVHIYGIYCNAHLELLLLTDFN